MYDSFDMACQDEETALRLNIKVNSENLLPHQQKYNVGSLRLPADPSWPKIPQRRLADDIGELTQPPCIANLNGTPRRSRTVPRVPQSQSCKFHYCQKTHQEPQNQQPRRRSGCADPRFKRVTTVRSQTTSTNPGELDINVTSKECKSVEVNNVTPWKDLTRAQVIQQAAEKPDETKESESIGIQTVQIDSNSASNEFYKNITETDQCRRKSFSSVKEPNFEAETQRADPSSKNKTPTNFKTDEITNPEIQTLTQHPQSKEVNNAIDENIVDTQSGENNNQYGEQNFNASVPLISYPNVPVLISTAETDSSKADRTRSIEASTILNDINIPKLEMPNDAVPRFFNTENTSTGPFLKGFQMKLDDQNLQHPTQRKYPESGNSECRTSCNCAESKSKQQINEDYKMRFEWSPEKLMKNIHNEEKCRPQQNPPNIFKDSFIPKHNFHIYCHECKPFQSHSMKQNSQAPISSNRNQPNLHQSSAKFNTSLSNDHDDKNFHLLNESGFNNSNTTKSRNLSPDPGGRAKCFRQRRKMKSDQHLMINKKGVQSSEPHLVSCGGRRSRAPCLKKANSYLSKWTQGLNPDSESTFMYSLGNNNSVNSKETDVRVIPRVDLNDVKREHCVKPYERPSNKSTKISSALNTEKHNLSSSKLPTDANLQDTMIEKPTAIPVKTQQLLNKSYWEYYNKLKLEKMENGESPQEQYFCQLAMGAPQSKKPRPPESITEQSNNTSQTEDPVELSLPEIRTLEQCSVLSTMINKTLDKTLQPSSETVKTKQIYLNANMRSSSDPTAGTQSAILKKLFPPDNEDSIISSTIVYEQSGKRDKQFNKTSKLQSIGEHPVVFFGCMVYAMIVFLPMIYDYFSYEEHDEYEDLSYVEIAFDFIIASFKEAFAEFCDMMYRIFFKPDSRMQQLSSKRWRRRISKQHLI